MNKVLALWAAIALLGLGIAAQAVVIDTVPVGDPGNAADSGYGTVGYNYNIGKYEVTAGQYVDFLNHKAKSDDYGLYESYMWTDPYGNLGCKIQQSGSSGNYGYSVASDWANRPVN